MEDFFALISYVCHSNFCVQPANLIICTSNNVLCMAKYDYCFDGGFSTSAYFSFIDQLMAFHVNCYVQIENRIHVKFEVGSQEMDFGKSYNLEL